MLGWEFPPFISGGLGTACYGLTKAMSEDGVEVVFVLPRPVRSDMATHVRLVAPAAVTRTVHVTKTKGQVDIPGYHVDEMENVTFVPMPVVAASPYDTEQSYAERVERLESLREVLTRELMDVHAAETSEAICPAGGGGAGEHYGRNLMSEVHRYAHLLMGFAPKLDFDVIHAHDWMTFPAGLAVSHLTGKPLVVHVHSTEFDRSGERVDQRVYDIERAGMHGAAQVVAVSNMTKNLCVSRYGVSPDKVTVVYNAIELNNTVTEGPVKFETDDRIVLFLGRITMQKGPEYFVAAAKKVLQKIDNVKFVMAGSGDMFRRVIELAAGLGIGHKILFTGFLRGDNVEKIFRMADLFVMPSVSEPFGLVPLEAMSQNVPVIISKQSGVSEVITHALKVDFWDIDEMANKIIAVLRHPPLGETLKKHAHFEVRKFSWHDASQACLSVYERALGRSA
jgi:glycosyltransferase involved in cell wall biosynthesis